MTSRPQSNADSLSEFDAEGEFIEHELAANKSNLKLHRLILGILVRWYWIALGLMLGFFASAYYLSKAPQKFSATATLLIKQQTPSLMSRDQVDVIDMRSAEGLNTAAARIRRDPLLQRVASRDDVRSLKGLIQPAPDFRPAWLIRWFNGRDDDNQASDGDELQVPPPETLAGWIGSWTYVSIRGGTRLMDVSVNHEVPEITMVIANAIIDEYIAETVGSVTEGRTSTSEALLNQSEEVRARLQSAESALATYNRALELHKSLEERENEVSQLTRRYLPKHPTMIAAEGALAQLKSRFLDEFEFAMRSPADLDYWKTAGVQLDAVKSDPEAHLRLARQLLLARTGVLLSEINSQMQVFNTILTRIEETNVNLRGEQAGAEIHNLATIPWNPSFPDRKRIRMIGAVSGLGMGAAVAFLLVRLDNKFKTVAQTEEETARPVLAAISDIDKRHLRKAVRAHSKTHPADAPNPQQELWDPNLIFQPGTSHTNYAEMFRVLRASVILLGDESKRKVTVFASALSGEGKSFVSSNFALATAGQGRKTLIIDLDLRKPRLHSFFGVLPTEQGLGVADWLDRPTSLDEIIHRDTGANNLHIIFAGFHAKNPGELLTPARLRQLFAEAREKYDAIVVDTAPLLPVPDTRLIAPLADNFCLVVRANYASKGAVLRTLELLDQTHTPPSGIVLNGFKESRLLIGQNYSYGAYRLNRYGLPTQCGYGTHGAYGAYGSDAMENEIAVEKEILRRRRKAKNGKT